MGIGKYFKIITVFKFCGSKLRNLRTVVLETHSRVCILGEHTVSAEELKNSDSGFNEVAPDRSTSQAGTSTHSSKKSDDGGYVQGIFFEASVASIDIPVRA
jgi:hypothetical protein